MEYFKQDGVTQLDRPDVYTNEPFTSEVGRGTPGFTDFGDLNGSETVDAGDAVFRPFNLDGSAGQNVQ